MKKILLISLVAASILACKEPKQLKTTFVFDKALISDKYPSYMEDMVMPFFISDCESADEILLKPLHISRSDIKRSSKEINAWFFESMGELSVEFSKDWLKYYFKDSLVHPYLRQKTKSRPLKLESYLKEGRTTFIYHESADEEVYRGHTIYADGESLNKAIQEVACDSEVAEVFVLINPSILAETLEDSSRTKKTDSIIPPPGPDGPCNQLTTNGALNLNDAIVEIINPNKSLTERLNEAEDVWKKYCHPNAYVALFKNKDDESIDVWDPGNGKNYFTNRLAILESIVSTSIFRLETANDGKISGIHIIECQNAEELL